MIITALLLGLGGSLHCVGMCSPLAISVTSFSKNVWLNRLLYNIGRILTYAVLGLLVSLIGSALPFHEYRTFGTVAIGILLVLTGLGLLKGINIPGLSRVVQHFILFIKIRYTALLSKKNRTAQFLLGSLNGVLPCGLTYLALSYCVFVEPVQGFLFMVLFGASTLPAMIGTPLLFNWITRHWRIRVQRLGSVAMIFIGLLLITRVLMDHNHSHDISPLSPEPVVCKE
jgi:uncharacterized protein